MHPTTPHHSNRRAAVVLIAVALAFAALFMLLGPPRGDARGKTLEVAVAQNPTLGKRILVTGSGRTLYTLSAETRGRFICKDSSCTSTWPPLTLGRGVQPSGVRDLGTIRRPDGRRQVTYKGRPLYRFASDRKRGDVGGEGFRDVGTWHAAVAPSTLSHGTAVTPAPTPRY